MKTLKGTVSQDWIVLMDRNSFLYYFKNGFSQHACKTPVAVRMQNLQIAFQWHQDGSQSHTNCLLFYFTDVG
jgi:hypothetical protein